MNIFKKEIKKTRFAEILSKTISQINLFLIELTFIWPIITFFWRYCLRRVRVSLHASEDSAGLNSSDKAEKLKLILLKFIEPKFDFCFKKRLVSMLSSLQSLSLNVNTFLARVLPTFVKRHKPLYFYMCFTKGSAKGIFIGLLRGGFTSFFRFVLPPIF